MTTSFRFNGGDGFGKVGNRLSAAHLPQLADEGVFQRRLRAADLGDPQAIAASAR